MNAPSPVMQDAGKAGAQAFDFSQMSDEELDAFLSAPDTSTVQPASTGVQTLSAPAQQVSAPVSEMSDEELDAFLQATAPELGAGDYIQQAFHSMISSFGEILPATVDFAGLVGDMVGIAEREDAHAYAETMRKFIREIVPAVEGAEDSFLASTLPGAIGSTASFFIPGALATKAVAGAGKVANLIARFGTPASLGAIQQGAAQFYEAETAGASEDDAWKAFALGTAVGTSEALPIAQILNRANKTSGGLLRRALIEGTEELLQESGQTIASNAIAQSLYEEDRKLLDGALEGGAAGFLTGMLFSASFSALERGDLPSRKEIEDAPEPEGTASVQAQVDAFNEGRIPAFFLPPGSAKPEGLPDQYELVRDKKGDLYMTPEAKAQFDAFEEEGGNGFDNLGELLGYGTKAKPETPTHVLASRDEQGRLVRGTLVDEADLEGSAAALEAATRTAGPKGRVDTLTIPEGAELLQERAGERATVKTASLADAGMVHRILGPGVREVQAPKGLEYLGGYAEERGRRVAFLESDGKPLPRAGFINKTTGTLFLDANAGSNEHLWGLLAHEMTHAFKDSGGDLVSQLQAIAPEALAQFTEQYKARYKEATGNELPASLEGEEGAALLTENLGGFIQFAAQNPGVLEQIGQADRTLLQRVVDAVVAFLDKVGIKLDSSTQRELRRLRDAVASTEFEATADPAVLRDLATTITAALDSSLGEAVPPPVMLLGQGQLGPKELQGPKQAEPVPTSEVEIPTSKVGSVGKVTLAQARRARKKQRRAGQTEEQLRAKADNLRKAPARTSAEARAQLREARAIEAKLPKPALPTETVRLREPAVERPSAVAVAPEPAPEVISVPLAEPGERLTPGETKRRVIRASNKQSHYQGNKREFLRKNDALVARLIREKLGTATTIYDMYSGGGTYGLSIAASGTMPALSRIVINEVDPTRTHRLKLAMRTGSEHVKLWKTDPLLQEIWKAIQPLFVKSSSPAALALDVAYGESDSSARKEFFRFRDRVASSAPDVRAAYVSLRDEFFSGRTASLDRIYKNAVLDADHIKAHTAEAEARGVRIEVTSLDATGQEAVRLTQRGGQALVLLDPPYHQTASGTYRSGDAQYDFKSDEFLALNADSGLAMAPGNVVFYHNNATPGTQVLLAEAFGSNNVEQWSRKGDQQELFGVFDARSEGRNAADVVGAGGSAAAPETVGEQPGVLGRVGADAGRVLEPGTERDGQRPGRRITRVAAEAYSQRGPSPSKAESAIAAYEEGEDIRFAVPAPKAVTRSKAYKWFTDQTAAFDGQGNPLHESWFQQAQRRIQNKFNRPGVYFAQIRKEGHIVKEAEDVVAAEVGYVGRAKAKVDDFQRDVVKPLVRTAAKAKLTLEEIDEYLIALHAKDRNRIIAERDPAFDPEKNPGSGVSDSEANKTIKRLNAKAGSSLRQISRLAQKMVSMHRATLVEGGLSSDEEVTAWKETFGKNYVPLRDIVQGRSGIKVGKGFDIRGSESFRAKGRGADNLADSPLTHLIAMVESGFVRAEKNKVTQTMARAVEAHPNDKWWRLDQEKPTAHKELADWVDRTVHFKENGEERTITFTDPIMARSFRNMQPDIAGGAVRVFGAINRVLSSLSTSFNPEFVFTNLARDMQTAGLNLSAEQGKGFAKNVVNRKAIWNAAKGIRAMQKAGFTGATTEAEKAYLEMREEGGLIGWYHQPDLTTRQESVQQAIDDIDPSNPRKAWLATKALGEWVSDWNSVVEGAVRLSAYQEARRRGISKRASANLSKQLTVDFNRKGEWGTVMNSFYLFFNASVQGSARMLKMGRTRAGKRILGGLVAAGAASEALNYMVAGDDEEDGENRYGKIPGYVKNRRWVFWIPGTDRAASFPMPYGFNVPFALGQNMMAAMMGHLDPGEAASRAASAAWESFNPVGSEASLAQILSPSVIDPFVQASENQTFYGAPIHKDQSPYGPPQPASQLYWSSMEGTALQKATTALNRLTGGSKVKSGVIDINPEMVEHWLGFIGGGTGRFGQRVVKLAEGALGGAELEDRDVPFVRQFTVSPSANYYSIQYRENANMLEVERKHVDALEKVDPQAAEIYSSRHKAILDIADEGKATESAILRLTSHDLPYTLTGEGRNIKVYSKGTPPSGVLSRTIRTEEEREAYIKALKLNLNRLVNEAKSAQ